MHNTITVDSAAPRRRRRSLSVTAAALLVGLATLVGAPAQASTGTAATWVATQLTTPVASPCESYLGGSGTPDVGVSTDGVFALAAAGTAADVANENCLLRWLNKSTNSQNYFRGGFSGPYYPGASAKLALAAYTGVQDGLSYNAKSFAGVNLITQIKNTQVATGNFPDARDTPTYFGYANPTTQALAVIALTKGDPTYNNGTGRTLADAVDYLIGQKCADDTYPGIYGGCSTTNPYDGDVDTTAVVAVALDYYNAQTGDPTSTGAATEAALAYAELAALQGTGTAAVGAWQNYCQSPWTVLLDSVNSTGLATAALNHAGGYATNVADGQSWLLAAQSSTPPDTGSQPACTSTGAGNVRATVQGILGLAGLSYVDLI
jgi:hypothetical protein